MKSTMLGLLAGVLMVSSAFAADVVWIEGESAVKTNLSNNNWIKGDNPKLLSKGDAFGAIYDRNKLPAPAFVLWKFDVAKEGTYHVYFRHTFKANMGDMRYRFVELDKDGKPVNRPGPEDGWIKFDMDVPSVDLREIGKFRTIEWTRLEPVTLKAGSYYLDLQVTGPNPGKVNEANPPVWVMIDAICLTSEPFVPNGDTKPGEKPTTQQGGKDENYY